MANEKIRFYWKTVVERVLGKGKVEALALRQVETGETFEEPVDGLFVFVGTVPNTDLVREEGVALDAQGYVITDAELGTSVTGVFAAGDVRAKKVRQVATAVGDGAEAALAAERFLTAPGF